MTIAASDNVLVGTSEAVGATITAGGSANSTFDVLGLDVVDGLAFVYLKFTSTVTTGTVDFHFLPTRTGSNTVNASVPTAQVVPIVGDQVVEFGPFPCPRYVNVFLKNSTSASITKVFLDFRAVAYR